MTRLRVGQRVKVACPLCDEREPLRGLTGTVKRLMTRGPEAWVRLDSLPPAGFASFPENDGYDRANHIVLDAEECEAI